jgi:MFS family permease
MTGPERQQLMKVMWFVAGNLLFGTGLIFHAFLYNFYLEALHLSAQAMGHAAAALTAGGLVVLVPAGALGDRLGPKAVLMTGAAVLAIGLALGAVAVAPVAIYAAAALAGAGSGMWRVVTAPILMELTGPRVRARAFAWNVGLLVAWGGVGTAIAGATSQWLEARYGFDRLLAVRAALVLGAIGSAASLLPFRALHLAAGSTPVGAAAAGLPPAGADPVGWRDVVPLIGLVAVWMVGPALAAPFFNIFFSREHGLSIARTGFVFAGANVAWALAVFASGEVAVRIGVRRLLVAALLFFAPAMWGLSTAGTVELAIVLYFLQGLIAPVTNPLIDQWLLGQTPRERMSAVSSWRQVAADASAMVGASVGGRLLVGGAFDALFLVAGAVGLVGALGLIVAVTRRATPH